VLQQWEQKPLLAVTITSDIITAPMTLGTIVAFDTFAGLVIIRSLLEVHEGTHCRLVTSMRPSVCRVLQLENHWTEKKVRYGCCAKGECHQIVLLNCSIEATAEERNFELGPAGCRSRNHVPN
jgi:hypothetical protein